MSPVTRLCGKCKQRIDEDLVQNTRLGYFCSSCMAEHLEKAVGLLADAANVIKPTGWVAGWYAIFTDEIWKNDTLTFLKELEAQGKKEK
jgi:hypothetical protein